MLPDAYCCSYTGHMTTNQTTLTNYIYNGVQQRADAGAQSAQGASLNIKICGDCGGKVVFVQSAKTDKWYLANVFTYKTGNFYYVKSDPHFKTCGIKQATNTVAELLEQIKELNAGQKAEFEKACESAPADADRNKIAAKIFFDTEVKIEEINAEIARLRAEGARN